MPSRRGFFRALLGEREIGERLASHLIPYDEMVRGDYDAFLIKRAELVYSAMNRLCQSD